MKTFIHEEIYRGEDLFGKIAAQPVTVFGSGAIGSNLIDNMIRQGFKKICTVDFDRVEDHNRHTQIYGRRDIGLLKVKALQSRIYNDLGVQIDISNKKVEESNVSKFGPSRGTHGKDDPAAILVDSFDNSESRSIIHDYAKKEGRDCLHIGLYQDYAEVVWNERYRVPKDTEALDVCEYPLARNIILLAVAVGTESILRFIDSGVKEDYYITLGDLKVSRII